MGKQFNIKGQNGLYLSNQPTTTVTSSNYQSLLIQDFDFFPKSKNEANLFDLKNVRYRPVLNQLYGSNSIAKSNSNIPHSYIFRGGNLIPNKKYFNTFKMYFNFTGSDLGTYAFPGFSTATLSSSVLNALRIKIYIQLGATLIPATLSNLQKVVANNAVASNSASWVNVVNATDVSGGGGNIAISDGTKTGIQLTTGLNSEPCIDMRWSTANIFKFLSTNGYGFRMDVSLGNLERQALKTKEYKIIVKYFNIGVTSTTASDVPLQYRTSESVELMSNNYIYYQKITIPVSISRIGGGGGMESVAVEIDLDPGGGETT